MIRHLIQSNFSKLSKGLIFENKKGSKLIFTEKTPENGMKKIAKNKDQNLKIEQRLMLLFDQYKTERVLNQANYDDFLKLKEEFLKTDLEKKNIFLLQNHPKYFYLQCQMINEYLDRFDKEITEKEIYALLNAIQNGLFFVEDQFFVKIKKVIFTPEEEQFILDVYHKLCGRLIINLSNFKQVRALCQLMKYIKRYSTSILDQINQQLLASLDQQISLEQKLYYTLFLVKAGINYFPSLIYQLRDEVLENEKILRLPSESLFELFEIFGRCSRVTLCSSATYKLFTTIIQTDNYSQLILTQQVLLLYYASKTLTIQHSTLKPLIEQKLTELDLLKGINLKIFLLTLYNTNYKSLGSLKNLEKLKIRFQEIEQTARFSKEELKYFNDLMHCL
ncbi:unnamed protein product (macronuclear) [Paramecium tetraurelia]|uniref:PCI domain-containing protein n=1 Tax=Paramecium tetraurelia TaxID=5888 RepID=A0BBY9_PARTE|nr:uncharacterized protein GSPATT00000492001 [Paramecium tetraurelia]CAK56056.1 unnamed protein product [Paramecium tetraurelia]|eukprot:XP_001423454.1 hypothetical protein (macronuclear) [Paramecium tetraurelia strain d4-2]